MMLTMVLALMLPATPPPVQHPRHHGVVTLPRLIFMPPIERHYPREALNRGEQGLTRLYCTLQITGRLAACRVQQSSGFPDLDAAAFRVAEGVRYSPMLVDGNPVEEPVILPVRWMIGD